MMGNLMATLLIASAVILLALLILGIGWLLTGKNKLRSSCGGMNVHLSNKEGCGSAISCPSCAPQESQDKKTAQKKSMPTGENNHLDE